MPIIQVTLVQGREPEVVKRFAKKVARLAHEELNAPLDAIRVMVTELPPTHWAVGDRTRDEIDAEKAQTARKTKAAGGTP